MRWELRRFKSIGSTNDFLKAKCSTLKPCTVAVAAVQTKGRGRCNRRWMSGRGGLWFSVLLEGIPPEDWYLVNFAAALSVAEVLDSMKVDARIKWPNDVILLGKRPKGSHLKGSHQYPARGDDMAVRKVCGILVETLMKDKVYTVVGIGVNVNNRPPAYATSVMQAIGRVDADELLEKILGAFGKYMDLFIKGRKGVILDAWKRYWLKIPSEVKIGKNMVLARPVRIMPDGRLQVSIVGTSGQKNRQKKYVVSASA